MADVAFQMAPDCGRQIRSACRGMLRSTRIYLVVCMWISHHEEQPFYDISIPQRMQCTNVALDDVTDMPTSTRFLPLVEDGYVTLMRLLGASIVAAHGSAYNFVKSY
jgi:hypothetical protein